MSLNLNDLLASLEQSSGIEKVAETTPVTTPNVAAELASVLEKKASTDLIKSAREQGEALAKELLSKLAEGNEITLNNDATVAQDNQKVLPTNTTGTVEGALQGTVATGLAGGATSDDLVDKLVDGQPSGTQLPPDQIPNAVTPAGVVNETITNDKDPDMDKTAQENKALAQQIMKKLAQDLTAEVTTPAAAVNVAGAAVPNEIQAANAVTTAQADAAAVGVAPGPGATVDDLFKAIVARAESTGAGTDNIVEGDGPTPMDTLPDGGDEVEKAAAVSALCAEGLDFASAVELVKQAEIELKTSSDELEKAAAVSALCAEGLDFADAVALVKQAEAEMKSGSWQQEKVACLDALMKEGINFNDAVELVKQAEADLIAAQGK